MLRRNDATLNRLPRMRGASLIKPVFRMWMPLMDSPAVALQQQRGTSNARSSVGSVTTLSSLVRMMYSRAGAYPAEQPMLYAEDFSPNTPQGACPSCHGLGHIYDVTEALMVPDPSLSIRDRAIASRPPAPARTKSSRHSGDTGL